MKRASTLLLTMLCCLVLLCACAGRRQAPSATIERPQWGQAFQQAGLQPAQGTMVLLHDGADAVQVYNPARAATPMLPASTFKILNACIALETGVASGPDQVFPWNGVTHSVAAWNRDLTLQEAFAASSVPVFQELARRIGHERMQKYVQQARYGNANIGGEIDSFWLRGALRISAREQLDFLQRLYHNRLPFSRRTMAMVKDIMVVEQGHGWTLRAKTGVAVQDTPHIGWWVGWVERGEKVWFFALNIDVAGPEQYGLRQQIVKTILKAEGILP